MTTVDHLRQAVSQPAATVSIAGVPWPTYKVVALLVGLIVFLVVGVVTATVAPAVLSGAGVATLAWITLGVSSALT